MFSKLAELLNYLLLCIKMIIIPMSKTGKNNVSLWSIKNIERVHYIAKNYSFVCA